MLTKRQHELLVFINQRLTETGVSPSFKEMMDAMGLRSTNTIYHRLAALEERGFIRRLHFRIRAIEVLRLPANMEPTTMEPATHAHPELVP